MYIFSINILWPHPRLSLPPQPSPHELDVSFESNACRRCTGQVQLTENGRITSNTGSSFVGRVNITVK
jgi:hypothetical protein